MNKGRGKEPRRKKTQGEREEESRREENPKKKKPNTGKITFSLCNTLVLASSGFFVL